MSRSSIHVQLALPEHAQQIINIIHNAYDSPSDFDDYCDECMQAYHVRHHIEQFPKGQFVALDGDLVAGFALTMRTNRSPQATPLRWIDAIGGLNIRNHETDGNWLYGIEFAVRRDYRKRGIGTQLYAARFQMVQDLGLKGFYAGGMLAGYPKHAHRMNANEYANRIMRGELKDPTVSMQMHRGFKPKALIPNYTSDPEPYNNAMLIVWDNPQYQMMTA